MNSPTTPTRTVVPGNAGHLLLRRVMKMRVDMSDIECVTLVDHPDLRITLRDTGPGGTAVEAADGDTAIHLLWAMDDDSARLIIGGNNTLIHPGDMVVLAAGTCWRAWPQMILCEISTNANARTARSEIFSHTPVHGRETFHGHNRETTYPAPPGLSISRWKVTQPLTLPPSSGDRYIVDLAAPVAMVWPGGTDLIGRGECRRIPPGSGPITLLPDGLGYVLVTEVAPLAPEHLSLANR